MKIVLVSQRVHEFKERNEISDCLDQRLINFLVSANYLPFPIPNSLIYQTSFNFLDAWISHIAPSAIVLSGGNDLGDYPSRDLVESRLLKYAEDKGLPLLGICRGMQLMAIHAGGKLKKISGHIRVEHLVMGEINRNVNSFHNYSLANCPKNYTVIAHSQDGEIEAIRHNLLRWEGWMWHPERELVFQVADIDRVKALFDE